MSSKKLDKYTLIEIVQRKGPDFVLNMKNIPEGLIRLLEKIKLAYVAPCNIRLRLYKDQFYLLRLEYLNKNPEFWNL